MRARFCSFITPEPESYIVLNENIPSIQNVWAALAPSACGFFNAETRIVPTSENFRCQTFHVARGFVDR